MPTYSTNFALEENPISERNVWVKNGTLWTKVRTLAGVAQGTQDNAGNFDDSTAYLSGFDPDQSASAVIRKGTTDGLMEVEILLRWLDTSSTTRGYECNLAHDGSYTQIVRWNGALGSFTVLFDDPGAGLTVNDGDVFSANIVGNIIRAQLNGVEISTIDITSQGGTVYTFGGPGLGFYRSGGTGSEQYGFKSWSATDGRLGPPSGRRSPAQGQL